MKQSPILVHPRVDSISSRLINIQSSFESLDSNRQLSEHGSENVNIIVNAINKHIPEQVQLSTKVKNISRHSTLLYSYTLQDDKRL